VVPLSQIVKMALVLASGLIACSPEATRTRNGGAGADPGNKRLIEVPAANPLTTDTTLWPGRAPAPVDRLERGEMAPPAGVRLPNAVRGRAP
jgi:hypothetical protein